MPEGAHPESLSSERRPGDVVETGAIFMTATNGAVRPGCPPVEPDGFDDWRPCAEVPTGPCPSEGMAERTACPVDAPKSDAPARPPTWEDSAGRSETGTALVRRASE